MLILGIVFIVVAVIGIVIMWKVEEFTTWVQNLGRRDRHGRH